MPYRDAWARCQDCGKQFIFTVEEQRRLAKDGLAIVAPALCPACQQKAEAGPGPHHGVIKWYDAERGYGFITQRSGRELFFHRTAIAPGGPALPAEGARVTFMVEERARGPQAVDVVFEAEEDT